MHEAIGALPEWRIGERVSECDIDPSFPKRTPRWEPPLSNMFEGSYEGLADWLANGPTPDFDALLGVKEINEIAGRWVRGC